MPLGPELDNALDGWGCAEEGSAVAVEPNSGVDVFEAAGADDGGADEDGSGVLVTAGVSAVGEEYAGEAVRDRSTETVAESDRSNESVSVDEPVVAGTVDSSDIVVGAVAEVPVLVCELLSTTLMIVADTVA